MMFMKITGTPFTCRKIEYGCVCLGPKHEKMGWSHMVGKWPKWPSSWCGFREIPGASFNQRGLFSHIYGPVFAGWLQLPDTWNCAAAFVQYCTCCQACVQFNGIISYVHSRIVLLEKSDSLILSFPALVHFAAHGSLIGAPIGLQ